MKRTVLGTAIAAYLGVTLAAVFAPPLQARPITPAERRYVPNTGALPFCDDPNVLSQITSRFSQREQEYWKSGLEIVGYDRIHETGYRTTGYDFVPRRYCEADAGFNDQKARRVVYWVGEDFWFAGYGSLTEWCIIGVDHNHAGDYACRATRP